MKIKYEVICENAMGYERARIPCIVCTDNNTLITCYETRKAESDWAVIDIGMRKSRDGGKTWSDRKILVSSAGVNTINNPVMICDGEVLHFLYCINYSRVFYMKSTDEGESWSEAKDLTEDIRRQTGDFRWTCVATGPCHGLRTETGRLLVPLWFAYNEKDTKSHHPSVIAVMCSDDRGETWKTGPICNKLNDASEFSLAETHSGIVANIRHEGRSLCRAAARLDEGCNITDIKLRENLPDPVCCAGFISSGSELLFSNCASKTERENLTLRRLDGDFGIKESILINKNGGYSDIALSADKKTAYVLYEYEKSLICAAVSV